MVSQIKNWSLSATFKFQILLQRFQLLEEMLLQFRMEKITTISLLLLDLGYQTQLLSLVMSTRPKFNTGGTHIVPKKILEPLCILSKVNN